jgi:hypothetical protein
MGSMHIWPAGRQRGFAPSGRAGLGLADALGVSGQGIRQQMELSVLPRWRWRCERIWEARERALECCRRGFVV